MNFDAYGAGQTIADRISNFFKKPKKVEKQDMIIMPKPMYDEGNKSGNIRANNSAQGKVFCILNEKDGTINVYQNSYKEYGQNGRPIYHRFSYKINKNDMENLSKKKLESEEAVKKFIQSELPQLSDGKLTISTCCLEYDRNKKIMNINTEKNINTIKYVDNEEASFLINNTNVKDMFKYKCCDSFRLGLILIRENKIKDFINLVEKEKSYYERNNEKLPIELKLLHEIVERIENKEERKFKYDNLLRFINQGYEEKIKEYEKQIKEYEKQIKEYEKKIKEEEKNEEEKKNEEENKENKEIEICKKGIEICKKKIKICEEGITENEEKIKACIYGRREVGIIKGKERKELLHDEGLIKGRQEYIIPELHSNDPEKQEKIIEDNKDNIGNNNFAIGEEFYILDRKNNTINFYQRSNSFDEDKGKSKRYIYYRFSYTINQDTSDKLYDLCINNANKEAVKEFFEENPPKPLDSKINISTCYLKYNNNTHYLDIDNEKDKIEGVVDGNEVQLLINWTRELTSDFHYLFRLGLILIREGKIETFTKMVDSYKKEFLEQNKELKLLYEIAKKIENKEKYDDEYKQLLQVINGKYEKENEEHKKEIAEYEKKIKENEDKIKEEEKNEENKEEKEIKKYREKIEEYEKKIEENEEKIAENESSIFIFVEKHSEVDIIQGKTKEEMIEYRKKEEFNIVYPQNLRIKATKIEGTDCFVPKDQYLISFNEETGGLNVFINSKNTAYINNKKTDAQIYFKLSFNVKQEKLKNINFKDLKKEKDFAKLITELKPENITVSGKIISFVDEKGKQTIEEKYIPEFSNFQVPNKENKSIKEIIEEHFTVEPDEDKKYISHILDFLKSNDIDVYKKCLEELRQVSTSDTQKYLFEKPLDIDDLEKLKAAFEAEKNGIIKFRGGGLNGSKISEVNENSIGGEPQLKFTKAQKEEINKAFLEDHLDDDIPMESGDNSENLLAKLSQKREKDGYLNALRKYGIDGKLSKEAFIKKIKKEGDNEMLGALADKLEIDKEVNDMDTLVGEIKEKEEDKILGILNEINGDNTDLTQDQLINEISGKVKDSKKFEKIKQNIKQQFQEKQNKRKHSLCGCCYSQASMTEEELNELIEKINNNEVKNPQNLDNSKDNEILCEN